MVVAVAVAEVVMFMAASVMPGTLFVLGVMCSPGLRWFDTTVFAILRKYILTTTIGSVRGGNGDISMIFKEHKGICFPMFLRTKTNTAALLRKRALETYPPTTHTQTHTHTPPSPAGTPPLTQCKQQLLIFSLLISCPALCSYLTTFQAMMTSQPARTVFAHL